MTLKGNKEVVRQFIEDIINRRNLDAADRLLAPDYAHRNPVFPSEMQRSREGMKQIVGMLLSAFPDAHITIEDMIAEGDRVTLRMTTRGTHRGELMGIPPTGRKVAYASIDIFRVVDGRLKEGWACLDGLGIMRQLGADLQKGRAKG